MTFLIFLLNIFYFSDVIMGIHTSTDGSYITEHIFHVALGAGFANARDWNTLRVK